MPVLESAVLCINEVSRLLLTTPPGRPRSARLRLSGSGLDALASPEQAGQ